MEASATVHSSDFAGLLLKSAGEARQKYANKNAPKMEVADAFLVAARYIDWSLALGQRPASTQPILHLLLECMASKDDAELRPAVMVLFLSAKAACRQKWFSDEDQDLLLQNLADLWNYATRASPYGPSNPIRSPNGPALENWSVIAKHIDKLLKALHPWFRLQRTLTVLEAQAEYSVLACDFPLPKKISPEERVRLFTYRKDAKTASLAFATPSAVSFLVNGEPVAHRSSVDIEKGAMPPSDITLFVRVGSNLIQAVGLFPGPFLIAIIVTTDSGFQLGPVLDHEQRPRLHGAEEGENDVVEGTCRISLKCPMSFARMVQPAKGAKCRHRQCFDLDNYLDSNRRVPAWRCPVCSNTILFQDLRIDRSVANILEDPSIRQDPAITTIEISPDGTWRAVSEEDDDRPSIPAKRRRAQAAEQPQTDTRNAAGEHESRGTVELSDEEEGARGGTGTQSGQGTPTSVPVVDLEGEDKPIANRFHQIQVPAGRPGQQRPASAPSYPRPIEERVVSASVTATTTLDYQGRSSQIVHNALCSSGSRW